MDAFKRELHERGLEGKIAIKKTGCRGFCENGPVMAIAPEETFYNLVEPQDVREIVSKTLVDGSPVERLLYVDPDTRKKIRFEKDIPFFSKQQRRVLGNCGQIDPTDITDYIASGGYQALLKALINMTPEQVIDVE